MKKDKYGLTLAFFLALSLFLSGPSCGGGGAEDIGVITLRGSTVLPETLALYYPIPVSAAPRAAPYTIPYGLSGVAGVNRSSLPPQVISSLQARGFAATVGWEHEHLSSVYQNLPGAPLVTVDAVLEAFYGMCAGIRLRLERGRLREDLERLLSSLLPVLEDIYAVSRGAIQEAAGRDLAFLGVAAYLLGLEVSLPPEVGEMVDAEIRLHEQGAESGMSPIFGYVVDYRKFRPPEGYLEDRSLQGYYRSMSWLGGMDFRPLWGESEEDKRAGKDMTRRAALLVGALHRGEVEGEPALLVWERIYQVSRFLGGNTLSLSVASCGHLMREELGETFPVSRLEEEEVVGRLARRFHDEAGRAAAGGVFGRERSPGFRLVETFIDPGEAIFRELTGEEVPGRKMPRGLDLPAVLGSDRALRIVQDFYGEAGNEDYAESMRRMRGEYGNAGESRTRTNLFWSRVSDARELFRTPGEGYPTFMRNEAWQDRDVYLFLSSWVRALAFARGIGLQGIAVEDRAQFGSPANGGYVEPRPSIYARLAADADVLRRGLRERGFLDAGAEEKLKSFYDVCLALKGAAERELRGDPLTEEEYALIGGFGKTLRDLVSFDWEDAKGEERAFVPVVVVDAYRDPSYGDFLQFGLGRPCLYYAVVPVRGKLTLVVGAGYSYYETVRTVSARFTVESWREALTSGERLESPAWTASFLQ